MSDWICTNELRWLCVREHDYLDMSPWIYVNSESMFSDGPLWYKQQQKWTRGKPVRYEYPEPDSTHEISGRGTIRVFKSGPIPAIGDNVTVAGENFTVTGVERVSSFSPFGLLLRESEPDYAEEWRDVPVAEE